MDLEVPQSITVPSLHVLGRADELLSAAQLLSVPSRCESMTMLWHKGGHVVPLLDGGIKAALRRFLSADAAVDNSSQEGTPLVLQINNRLPAPEVGSGAVAEVVAPRSAAERAARDAIAAVLELPAEGVSVEAGFFELGCLRCQIPVSHAANGFYVYGLTSRELTYSSFPITGGNSVYAVRVVSLLNTQLAANQVVNPYTSAPVACQECTALRVATLHYRHRYRFRFPFPCKVSFCIQPPQRWPGYCHHLASWQQTSVQSQLTS